MTEITVEEYMVRNQFTTQDVFRLLDWLVQKYGKETPPEEMAEKECSRMKKIRERQKVSVNQT